MSQGFRKQFLYCLATLLAISTLSVSGKSQARLLLAGKMRLDFKERSLPTERINGSYNNNRTVIKASKKVGGEWEYFKLSFTPGESGKVTLLLRGPSLAPTALPCWILFDDFEISGAELKNSGFEHIRRDGRLSGWGGGKVNAGSSNPRSGKSCARVDASNGIGQIILVTKGRKVTIGFYVREENPSKPQVFPPGSNVAVDPGNGSRILISSGRLEFRPTFENCGVYLNRTKQEKGKQAKVSMMFRKAGSGAWLPTLPLFDVPTENAWRGSIFRLRENTEYEVKVMISDDRNTTVTGRFRTLNSNVKILKTILLKPNPDGKPVRLTESGSAAKGYVRYTMQPGAIIQGGRQDGDQALVELNKVSYVILDNLRIKSNGQAFGLSLKNSQHVQVRNCEIFNFGRSGSRRRDLDGKPYDKAGKLLYNDAGILIDNTSGVLIERCYVHSPALAANTWFYSHPAGASAVRIINCDNGGIVLRYNDFVGKDRVRYIDVVQGIGNGSMNGGFVRDSDIYGNYMAFSNDDAIEIEGGEMNIRVYRNRFEAVYTGVSTGGCYLGPSYQIRNLYVNGSDEEGYFGLPFKNSLHGQPYGSIMLLNNTAVKYDSAYAVGNFTSKLPTGPLTGVLKAVSRNNIFVAQEQIFTRGFFTWKVDVDNDLLQVYDKEKAGIEKAKLTALGQERHGVWGAPIYMNRAGGDYRLAEHSPGRNQAAVIPNFEMKHLGAFQDDEVRWLPYRPLPVATDRQEIRFDLSSGSTREYFTVTTGLNGKEIPFNICSNEDFFSVSPKKGIFRSGEKIKFTVRLKSDQLTLPREYRGAILLRTESGYSLPISVFADNSNSQLLRQEALRNAIIVQAGLNSQKRKITGKVKIPKDGTYFVLAQLENSVHVRNLQLDFGPYKTDGKVRLVAKGTAFNRLYVPVRKGNLSAYYFHLKAGEYDFAAWLTGSRGQESPMVIKSFLITTKPELFSWWKR